ncbi:MAG: GNAT family N-acetyltransferase [Kurthia sp.]|nr:GNAT family N-acetyltransferase [Candidatus Kurthia equi]
MFTYPIDEELHLRIITQKDAQEIFELIHENRAYLKNWLGWLDQSTEVKDVQKNIHKNLLGFAIDSAIDTAIVYQGKIVGKIGFHTIDKSVKKAEIGYFLAEEYNGLGIMTRATEALVKIGFEHYQLHKIEIHCAEGNEKSQGIPKRLGFKQEGRIRSAEWLYDKYVNHYIFGLLREEWNEQLYKKVYGDK